MLLLQSGLSAAPSLSAAFGRSFVTRADACAVVSELHYVAVDQSATPADLDFVIDGNEALGDDVFGLGAGIDEIRELEKLPEGQFAIERALDILYRRRSRLGRAVRASASCDMATHTRQC